MESDLGIDSIKRVEIMAAVQEQVPGLPDVDNEKLSALQTLQEILDYLGSLAGTSQAPAPLQPPDLQDAVFTAVAEKTGYPKEMLEPSMDMESDLGIDSIKRVEIMAAVQERVSTIPDIDNERLAAARSLADVVALLAGSQTAPATTSSSQPLLAKAPSTESITASLTAIVARKTGYPQEFLSLEMDMESDLGIDSIKRVEIMAALQEEVPGLPELDNDRLSSLKTLRQVLDYVLESLGGPATPAAKVVPLAAETLPTGGHQPNYPSRRIPTPSTVELGAPQGPQGPVLITRDPGELAQAIATELDSRGFEVILLEADWSSPAAIAASVPKGVHTVIHAAAVNASGEDLEHRVRGAYLLARAVGEVSRFVTLSSQGGRFGLDGLADKALEGAQAGLTKTLALEWPRCAAIALDIDIDTDIQTIADAIFCQQNLVEIGLTPDETLSLVHPEVGRTSADATAPIEAGELIVVSGGARGVTAAVAIEMAKRWRPHLLLLGRSALPESEPEWAEGIPDEGLSRAFANQELRRGEKPSLKKLKAVVQGIVKAREVNKTLQAIQEAGASVEYVATDVRDGARVAATIQDTVARHGAVRGLVHGAGVLADKLVIDKTPEQFDQVFKTKVEGLQTLLAATGEDLKLLALFTSIAGRYGNRGQCDYAMANEALTRTGLRLARQGVRVKAFDWGPWDGGMVDSSLRKQFQASGIELIGLAEGAQFFCDELESGDASVEVVVGGPEVPGVLIPQNTEGEIVKNLEASEPYLRDHRIAGSAVLPAAMALEWMAQAAQDAFPKMHFSGIRDFTVVNGVILKTTRESLLLRWTQEPPAESQPGVRSFHCQLISMNQKLGLPKIHYRGIVDLTDSEPEQRSYLGSNGLGAHPYPYPVDEAYRRFLFHGPSLRGIADIVGYSDEGMVARLNSSAPEQLGLPGGSWTTDPVAIDGALQMMLLWVREKYGNTALPASVADYRQYREFRGPVTCHLVMDGAEAKRGRFHATFVDDEGRVVACFNSGEYVATPKRIAFGKA
jgi:NAD(P)-dependent dehydrogenase (short-subunit alcohol dehydrogenase family)/acyl carrier protein